MSAYTFRSPIKANRDLVAAKLVAKGRTVTKRTEKRTIRPTVLQHDDKADPAKITGVKEGEPEEIAYFIVEADGML